MNILLQIVIYCAVALAGIVISALLPVSLPSSILSMVILFLLLLFRVIRKERISEVSSFLVHTMGLFFITPVVSMVAAVAKVDDAIIPILSVSVLAMLITFTASAYSIKFTIYLMNRRNR